MSEPMVSIMVLIILANDVWNQSNLMSQDYVQNRYVNEDGPSEDDNVGFPFLGDFTS
jgi:hypothetical protein